MTMRTALLTGAIASATLLLANTAHAQCSATAFGTDCWGIDADGSEATRATNVNALAARNAFFSNLVGVGTEDFEGFAAGTTPPMPIDFGAAGTATIFGDATVRNQGAGTNGFGRYPTSGVRYLEAASGTSGSTNTFRIDFSDPVAAFGFYGVDLGDFSSNVTLRFSLLGGGLRDWELPYEVPLAGGNIQYAGVIDTRLFTSVEFIASEGTATGDFFAFDDFSIGSLEQVRLVPEPASFALMGFGLVGLAGVARRRHQR